VTPERYKKLRCSGDQLGIVEKRSREVTTYMVYRRREGMEGNN
jgi:hypothetical protein